MADRNFRCGVGLILFGISMAVFFSGVRASDIDSRINASDPVMQVSCYLLDHSIGEQSFEENNWQKESDFRSRVEYGGPQTEMKYSCRVGNGGVENEQPQIYDGQIISLEFLSSPLSMKKKLSAGGPSSPRADNPLSIIISCVPIHNGINLTSWREMTESLERKSINMSSVKRNSDNTAASENKKIFNLLNSDFGCSGDRHHHLSIIASMYVSLLQYEKRHRKRARRRLIPEVRSSRADRISPSLRVACAPAILPIVPGPTTGYGKKLESKEQASNRSRAGKKLKVKLTLEVVESRMTPISTFPCESQSMPINIQIHENARSTNQSAAGEIVNHTTIAICPSKHDVYAEEWHSILTRGSPHRGRSASGRTPKYNLKYFKLFNLRSNSEMLCHLSKMHFTSSKGRRKRSIKGLPPQMIYTFLEQAIQPGGHISLKCSASGDPPPRFEWMLDNQILSPTSHRFMIGQYVDHTGLVISHLNITGARVEDGGQYECKTTNSRGHSSHIARLNVYGPPYIRSIASVRGITGSELTMLCPYYGYPISYVKWETNRFDITSEPRYLQSGGALKISGLSPSKDAGSLTCSVGSPGGELAKREIQLVINSPPVLSPLSFPPDLKSGERAQLSCTVISGDMPVYFSWQKDGLPIAASLQIEERSTEFFSYLLFKSLSAEHSGTYSCTSSNSAGKVNKSTEFVIKVPPYWSNEPQDVSTLLGSSVLMNCEAKGHPDPRTFWSKQYNGARDDFDLLSPINDHLTVFNNGSILINSVSSQDKGKYKCMAENGVGSNIFKYVFLDVNEPARFDDSSQNISVRRNDPITLVCDIQGDNPIKNTWTHNTNSIDKSSFRLSVSELKKDQGIRSQLTIERADRQDSGLYRCQASNSYGRSEHFIHLAVQERPDPPRQMEVIQVGSRSVRLSWQRPFDGNSPVLGYLLQYQVLRPGGSNSWDAANVVNVTIAVTSKQSAVSDVGETMEQGVVNGLLPDTTYSMRMLAVNQIESSPYSDSIMAKTQEEAPTEPPQNVQVQAGETGELIVTWQSPPMTSWHGPLLGYTVHWAEVTEADSSGQQTPLTSSATVKGTSSTRFAISGLGQFTKYRITVTAANRAGSGPASIPILGTTKEGVPTAPPQSVRCSPLSSQSLKIEWAAPPRSRLGGNLLGYKILYKPLTDIYVEESGTAAEVKRTSSSETYLHALLKYTNYSIQVLAYTGAGDGILSPAVFCTTEEDIPGQPADIKAMALTVESILVSWLPPKKPNGKIIFFTLYYREVGGGQPTSRQVSTSEASSLSGTGLGGAVEVRGLVEKKRYEFWLSASTGAGEGAAISPVTQVTSARAGARIASFGGVIPSGVGRSLLLGCLAVGNPTPRARWLHTQRPITHSHLYQVTVEGNLLIHNMDQTVSGNYTCSAKNLFGSDEITYSVICLLPPGPPSLQLLYTTASSAQLQWSPNSSDGGSPILGYALSFRRNEESIQMIDLSSEITSYKVIGLKCGSKYIIQISSNNRVGKGEPSTAIIVNTKGEAPKFPEEWSPFIWSNATCIVVEIRRALGGVEGSICPLLSLGAEWRKGDVGTWRATSVSSSEPLTLTALSPAQWFEVRLVAENHAGRRETVLRAATTTLSGATISPPAYFPMQPAHPHEVEGSQENIFNLISIILATIAAFSTLSVVYLLIRKRSVICHCNNESEYGVERQRSQSQASDEKTICAEQQNLRNSQHDYSTSPPKGHTEKMRREPEDMYEISPYATFQVGGPHRPVAASTLDHTLQFRTFGHMENESPPLQAPCRRHFPQKSHRHDNSKGDDGIDSGCELLQPLRMRGRHRQGSGPSYCVPMAGQGEGFQAVLHINKNDIC